MKPWLCGVDFGGTKLAVVLADREGKIHDKHVVYDQ
jgi:predicted NBD/HSP70 family sugar kinase